MKNKKFLPELVIELANSHDGNINKLNKLINESDKLDYQNKSIKFQVFSPDTISLNDYEWYQVYKKITFSELDWKKIFNTSSKKFGKIWIDIFDSFGIEIFNQNKSLVSGIKLQSSILENLEVRNLLNELNLSNTRLMINVSGYEIDKIENIIKEFEAINFKEIIIQIGFQSYPTKIGDTALQKIQLIKQRFNNKICLADHIDGKQDSAIDIPVYGLASGADMIEKHICLTRKQTKYDHFSSLEPKQFSILIKKIKDYLEANTGPFINKSESEYLEKSIQIPVLKKKILAGSIVSLEDLKFRRTNQHGISYEEIQNIQKNFNILKNDCDMNMSLNKKDFRYSRIGVIIAGRLKSSRLKRKALLTIKNKSSIQWCFDTSMKIKSAHEYILATSDLPEDSELEKTIKYNKKLKIYRGDPIDVINRYIGASLKYNIDTIIRITADCPFISDEIAEILLEDHFIKGADYTAAKNFAVGTSCEIINRSALEEVINHVGKADLSEYMTWYFQNNADIFKVNIVDLPKDLIRDYRLTLDYQEDLDMFETLLKKLKNKAPTTRNIFKVLDENPKINAINSHITLTYKTDRKLIKKLDKETRIKV